MGLRRLLACLAWKEEPTQSSGPRRIRGDSDSLTVSLHLVSSWCTERELAADDSTLYDIPLHLTTILLKHRSTAQPGLGLMLLGRLVCEMSFNVRREVPFGVHSRATRLVLRSRGSIRCAVKRLRELVRDPCETFLG